MANKKAKYVLDVPVEFGNVSLGDQTGSVGVKIDRANLNVMAADEALCAKRVNCRIQIGGNGDTGGQTTMVDDLHEAISAHADAKSISVNAKRIGTTLSFALGDLDLQTFAGFSKKAGRLQILSIEAIGQDAGAEDDLLEDAEDE